MDLNRQHRDGEHASAADPRDGEAAATEPVADADMRREPCRKVMEQHVANTGTPGWQVMRHMPMTYRRYVLRDVGNVPMSWCLTTLYTE